MKDDRTIWGNIKIDAYQHIILCNGGEEFDLTQLLAFNYADSFVNITIVERVDRSLPEYETFTDK